jgi:hypothetical protein
VVLCAPSVADAELYQRFQDTLGRSVFAAAGTDRLWARRAHAALVDEGLMDVRSVMHGQAWESGSDGALLVAGTLEQTRTDLRGAGLTDDELDRVTELLTCGDPRFVVAAHLMYSTSGHRPYPPTEAGGKAALYLV